VKDSDKEALLQPYFYSIPNLNRMYASSDAEILFSLHFHWIKRCFVSRTKKRERKSISEVDETCRSLDERLVGTI